MAFCSRWGSKHQFWIFQQMSKTKQLSGRQVKAGLAALRFGSWTQQHHEWQMKEWTEVCEVCLAAVSELPGRSDFWVTRKKWVHLLEHSYRHCRCCPVVIKPLHKAVVFKWEFVLIRELNLCLCLLSCSCRNNLLPDLNLQRRPCVYTAIGISCSNAQKHNSSDDFIAIYVLLYLKPGNFWSVELDSVNLGRMFLVLKSRHGL